MNSLTHFNSQAADWDRPDKIQMMKHLADKTLDVLKLDQPLDILDFGCGTGLFGLEMTEFAKSLVGLDTSDGMLEVFNQKTVGAENITSINCDLENENFDAKFDLIVSSMAFHHLENPGKMISKLKSMLNSGGRIAIVDLDQEDGSFHPDNSGMGVKHFGFSKQEIQSWADKSGMNLDWRIINEIDKNDKTYQQFLAVFS